MLHGKIAWRALQNLNALATSQPGRQNIWAQEYFPNRFYFSRTVEIYREFTAFPRAVSPIIHGSRGTVCWVAWRVPMLVHCRYLEFLMYPDVHSSNLMSTGCSEMPPRMRSLAFCLQESPSGILWGASLPGAVWAPALLGVCGDAAWNPYSGASIGRAGVGGIVLIATHQ